MDGVKLLVPVGHGAERGGDVPPGDDPSGAPRDGHDADPHEEDAPPAPRELRRQAQVEGPDPGRQRPGQLCVVVGFLNHR